MKRDKLWLLATAAVTVLMAVLPQAGSGLMGALALPFSAAGWCLRTLSLSGPIGNGAAIAVYLLICAVPLVFWWRSRRRTEDWLLVLLSGVTALVLYYMVNPNLRHSLLQNEVGDVVYAGAVWSTIVTWGVLKLVSAGQTLERNIYQALRIFLLLCAASCVISGLGTGTAQLIRSWQHYADANFGFGTGKLPTYLFLVLDFLALAAEDVLCALVLYKGTRLLDVLERDPFSTDCVEAANAVSFWCRRSLVIICLMGLALNIGQVLMSGELLNMYLNVRLPVMGLAICFALLSVTKLLVRGKELKDDNDLFV